MSDFNVTDSVGLARRVGLAWLAMVVIGIVTSLLWSQGININMTADVEAVATAMLDAEDRLRALAYTGLAIFALDLLVSVGFFLLLKSTNLLLAAWSMTVRIMASLLGVLSAIFLMNSADIASRPAYSVLADGADRLLLAGLQATSHYTSFHLSIPLMSAAMAGFYWLFLKSEKIPKLIAAWGLFASVFSGSTIVLRDFIPALGHDTITIAFILSNLIALVLTSGYLVVKGVRTTK